MGRTGGQKMGRTRGGLYFTGLKRIAQVTLIRGGFKDQIGDEHFYFSKEAAIKAIYEQLDKNICAACQNLIFMECDEWRN